MNTWHCGFVLCWALATLAVSAQGVAITEKTEGLAVQSLPLPTEFLKPRFFPHLPPPPLPPVNQFDQLIRASPGDRTNLLAGKSEEARRIILQALAEFDALPGEKREQRVLRLQVAQLRYFLRPLLRTNLEGRPQLLSRTPAAVRSLVEIRLAIWDKLPELTQREVMESDDALQHFVRLASPVSVDAEATNSPNPKVSMEVRQSWDRWQELSPEDRGRREVNFHRFFDLTTDEQIRAIGGLPLAERQRMESALEKFKRLPPDRRDNCIQNFDRLARLPEAERLEFLRNAAKWEAMSQAERDAWRRLVISIPPPPMPPTSPNVAGGEKRGF